MEEVLGLSTGPLSPTCLSPVCPCSLAVDFWSHSGINLSNRLSTSTSAKPTAASCGLALPQGEPHPSLPPALSGVSLFRGRAQRGHGRGDASPKRKREGRLAKIGKELEGTTACPATSSAWQPHGMLLPNTPSPELWGLLHNLVRHRLILEPWVFIQDGLDSETLDVCDSRS